MRSAAFVRTVLKGGLPEDGVLTVRCVAEVPDDVDGRATPQIDAVKGGAVSQFDAEQMAGVKDPVVRVARGFAYTSMQKGLMKNGTDALDSLAQALSRVGIGLADVVSCNFFLRDQANVLDLFRGFYEMFNKKFPPPPTRVEWQVGNWGIAQVIVRCVAALPVEDDIMM